MAAYNTDYDFWARVNKLPSGCWQWTGSVNARGYGQFGWQNRNVRAHRLAWELTNGPVPDKKVLCHSCDNKWCVNPDHLWVGTQADNLADMRRKGRGVAPPRPEFTDERRQQYSEARAGRPWSEARRQAEVKRRSRGAGEQEG